VTVAVPLAALAGVSAVLAAWDALHLAGSPRTSRALARAVGPWRAAGHGALPPAAAERRRLAILAGATAGAAGWLLAGPQAGLVVALLGPLAVHRALVARRARWRARVVQGAPLVARALADALAGGHAIRGALAEVAAAGGAGEAADRELRTLAGALRAGAATDVALEAWRARIGAPAYDVLVAAILLQREAGGDLAGLLRTLAGDLEAGRRATADAHAATSQARFTAGVVLAMPAAALALTQLVAPGAVGAVLCEPLPRLLAIAALGFDVVAVVAVRRLSRVVA